MKLKISEDLALPLDWLTLATVVYGARGSGKTTLGRVMAEEVTKAKQRFCAIDLKGDWHGLKSSADGKSPAIPVVIFGGDHADVPLEDGGGAFIGETVAALSQSCVLDLEHLSKGKQVRFLADFFERLYDKNRDPLLLLLDESQRYAPQSGGRGMDPQIQRCLGAVEDVVKLGRKHGIGPVLFTQRGSGLNKEVSELCDLLVAFRTPGPLDQDRIKDWLDANTTKAQRDDVMGQLAGLSTGTAVFASGHPDLKLFGVHAVRRAETFDSSATPKVGERRKEPRELAKADLTVLREKMAATIERAKLKDPKELRAELSRREKRIAELQRELDKAKAATKVETKTIEVRAPIEDELDQLKEQELRMTALLERMQSVAQTIEGAMQSARLANESAERLRRDEAPFSKPRPIAMPASAAIAPRRTVTRQTNGHAEAAIGNSGLRRILTALAQRPQGLTNRQIGIRAGMSSQSGTFSTYISKARTEGWIVDEGTTRSITDAGLKALGSYSPLPEGAALLEHWLSELGNSGAARILRAVAEAYPKALSNEQIGDAAQISPASGTFSTYLSKLRGLELIEGGRGTPIKASAELFD